MGGLKLAENQFRRKVLEPSHAIKDLSHVLKTFPFFAHDYLTNKIDKDFIKKLLLVVSEVNGCMYCSWFHGKMALFFSNIDPQVIENILSTEIGQKISDYEIIGLAYAQHYAATNKKPDPEAVEMLYEYYGKYKAECIQICIDIIYLANLAGNTFDAFLSRLKGQKSPSSSFLFELIFFILMVPVFAPIIPLVKIHKMNKFAHN